MLKLLTGGSTHEAAENDKNQSIKDSRLSDAAAVTRGVGLGVDSTMPGAAREISTALQINQLKKKYGSAKN